MSKNKIYLSEFIDDLNTLHRFVEYVEIDDLKNYFNKYAIGKAPFEEEEICSFYNEKTDMCHCLATVRKCCFGGDVDKCLIDRNSKIYEYNNEVDEYLEKKYDIPSNGKCKDYYDGKCHLSSDGVPCECRCGGRMDNCLNCGVDDESESEYNNCESCSACKNSCSCKDETGSKESEELGDKPLPPCKYKDENGYCTMADNFFCDRSDWHSCKMFADCCEHYDETLETCNLNGEKCRYWGDSWMCEVFEEVEE